MISAMKSLNWVGGHPTALGLFYACCVAGLLIFSVMIGMLIKCQFARVPKSSVKLDAEIFWTFVPFVMVVLMIYPTAKALLAPH